MYGPQRGGGNFGRGRGGPRGGGGPRGNRGASSNRGRGGPMSGGFFGGGGGFANDDSYENYQDNFQTFQREDSAPPPEEDAQDQNATTTTAGKRPAFKLRKAIHPKPALLLLHEMVVADNRRVRYETYDVPIKERERRAWLQGVELDQVGEFDTACIIDQDRYFGDGVNKAEARQVAAESALKGQIAKKCRKNESNRKSSEDFCPWGVLASLALQKMYESWQLQGYSVPKELLSLPNEKAVVKMTPPPEVRTNNLTAGTWMDKDNPDKPPLQRVNEMVARSGITLEFKLIDEVGLPNTKMFTFELTIDGTHVYKATNKSKKTAKADCALEAVNDSQAWYNPKSKAKDGEGEGTDKMETGGE